MSTKTVVLLGSFDTKGEAYGWLRDRIASAGIETLLVDMSVAGEPTLAADIASAAVAGMAGADVATLRGAGDRGQAVQTMTNGARIVVRRLYDEGKLDGIIGLGGSGGTSAITEVMKALPIGVPKLMVSTLASGDTRPFVGGSDITMMYPLADIAGLNALLVQMLDNAAGAIVGMVSRDRTRYPSPGRGVVGATQFGNTTPAVDAARHVLEQAGFEVVAFHASGTGGQSFESLARDGAFVGAVDISTTELADDLLGGIHSAGPHRLEAAAEIGLPQVVSVGALDMCDFGPMPTVPPIYAGRTLVQHNPHITLMRTTPDENVRMATVMADKLNKATGPVDLFLPLRGISMIDAPGKPFYDPEADAALFETLRRRIDPSRVRITELDAHINDLEFATAMADRLITLLS
jgi:uncharacterized protein (UPF0261 family)